MLMYAKILLRLLFGRTAFRTVMWTSGQMVIGNFTLTFLALTGMNMLCIAILTICIRTSLAFRILIGGKYYVFDAYQSDAPDRGNAMIPFGVSLSPPNPNSKTSMEYSAYGGHFLPVQNTITWFQSMNWHLFTTKLISLLGPQIFVSYSYSYYLNYSLQYQTVYLRFLNGLFQPPSDQVVVRFISTDGTFYTDFGIQETGCPYWVSNQIFNLFPQSLSSFIKLACRAYHPRCRLLFLLSHYSVSVALGELQVASELEWWILLHAVLYHIRKSDELLPLSY